jgi:hypothetical protein
MLMPVFEDGEADRFEEELSDSVKGIGMHKSVVTHTLVGSLCYRKFDNAHSTQYKVLTEEYGIKPYLKPVEY